MVIGIDGNEANVEKRVGISEYAFELLTELEKYDVLGIKYQVYLKNSPNRDLPKEREGWRYRVVHPAKLWTQVGLPFDLYTHHPRPDVFFSPTHYAPRFSPIPTAISVMDLSYIHYPEMFRASDLYQLRHWTAYSVKKSERVFTISKASKNDIIKIYHIPEDRVIVTYPGIKLKTQMSKVKTTTQNSKLKTKYGIEGEYILFVGTLQPRKNIERLIEAFAQIARGPVAGSATARSLTLVIIGKPGWLYKQIYASPKKFGVEEHVRFLNFIQNEDLPAFYKNARCFVLPSLYEGFGLPVLEAMQYGCPVITSNVSSLPEAAGDAALYVNPEDVSDIAAKIMQLVANEKLRKELIAKGYKQVKKFSWEKSAKQTLAILEEVAHER